MNLCVKTERRAMEIGGSEIRAGWRGYCSAHGKLRKAGVRSQDCILSEMGVTGGL